MPLTLLVLPTVNSGRSMAYNGIVLYTAVVYFHVTIIGYTTPRIIQSLNKNEITLTFLLDTVDVIRLLAVLSELI